MGAIVGPYELSLPSRASQTHWFWVQAANRTIQSDRPLAVKHEVGHGARPMMHPRWRLSTFWVCRAPRRGWLEGSAAARRRYIWNQN